MPHHQTEAEKVTLSGLGYYHTSLRQNATSDDPSIRPLEPLLLGEI